MAEKLPIPPRRTTKEARRFDTPATAAVKAKRANKILVGLQQAIADAGKGPPPAKPPKAVRKEPTGAAMAARLHSTREGPDQLALATEFVGLRLEAELLAMIDAFAAKHRLKRSAAIRKAVMMALHQEDTDHE